MNIETFPAFTDKLTDPGLRKAAQNAKDDGLRPSAEATFDTTDESRFVLLSETLRIPGQPDRTVRA